ncbi:MAG TPA: hypothetical protein VFR07_07395 [Mycobacteriales bacterium]|nr:hypothetical protein [Mycobacteriales bacterium]
MPDYTPLSDGDPFPADPYEIKAYGTGLVKTAELIAESVRLLRRCADENNWETEAADAFREKTEDLAKDIDTSRERYERVGSTIVTVSDTLDVAQTHGAWHCFMARQELAAAGRDAATPGTDPTGASVPLTPEQVGANAQRQAALDEIARLAGLFDDEVTKAREAADAAARTIRGALDDGVKDGWWDRNAGWLKVVTKVLAVIILIAGIVLLTVATGGMIWIAVAVSVGAGLLSLAINTGLAATGNGSWWDVAYDAVGVATFGAGALVTKALAKSMPVLKAGMANLKGAQAFDEAFGGMRLAWANFVSRLPILGSHFGAPLVARLADDAFDAMNAARTAATTAPAVSRAAAVLQGGKAAATDFAHARRILGDLRGLHNLPARLAPDAVKLEDLARYARNVAAGGVLATTLGTVNGLGQAYRNLSDGVDIDDAWDLGSYGQVVTDLLSKLR